MMDVIDQLIGETDVAQALAEKARLEGEAKGKAEGEAKGKAEGEAKGKAEGEAQALIILWEGRFGSPSEAVRAAVSVATSEQIQDVLRHWATDAAPEHVLARLGPA